MVLISGSGSNLLALLTAAASPLVPFRIVAVGADNPAEGLAHADLFGVPTFVVDQGRFADKESWAEKLHENISHFKPDLVVLAGFMKILPAGFVQKYSPNIINTHPSLLPKYPGAHAVAEALAAGERETGVSIHVVDEGVDSGPILASKTVVVMPADDRESLHERIKQVERELLVQTVSSIASKQIQLAKA